MRILSSLKVSNSIVTAPRVFYQRRSITRNIALCFMQSNGDLLESFPPIASLDSYLSSNSFPLSADLINAWSVNGATLNSSDLASKIFSISLFPYLAFLFFLSRKETNTPKIGNFGFQFLLVFVFATIPAGILAKLWYQDILANVDYLHGLAESLLTVTNLLIITGFFLPKFQLQKQQQESLKNTKQEETRVGGRGGGVVALEKEVLDGNVVSKEDEINRFKTMPIDQIIRSSLDTILLFIGLIVGKEFIHSIFIGTELNPSFLSKVPSIASYFSYHAEPANALSLPTWIVHTSSILEWLVAMRFIWEYAEIAKNPRWKELTWAMIPSHFSGLCAIAFHILYNSPSFNWIVNLQALTTTIGNTAMAYAAYRIWDYEKNHRKNIDDLSKENTFQPFEFLQKQEEIQEDAITDPKILFGNLLLKSTIVAVMIKYGEVVFNFPFDTQSNQMALVLVSFPTIFNIIKWAVRSKSFSLEQSKENLVKN